MNRCPGIKRDGSGCTVTVEPPQTYCWWHDPANADQRQRAASRGGKRAGRGRPQTELSDIKLRLSALADDVLTGDVEKGVAAVSSQILNVYLRAITVELDVQERQDLLTRMEALEEALQARDERGGYGA